MEVLGLVAVHPAIAALAALGEAFSGHGLAHTAKERFKDLDQ